MNTTLRYLPLTLSAALLLTACSQEDLSGGNALPEGRYPLAIASVTTSATLDTPPQTRVAENNDGSSSTWEWNGTEKIGVRIGSGSAGTYVLNENQQIVAETPCYWVTADPAQSVTAWYPADNGGNTTVSLADQSNGLAYVLRGSGTGNHTDAVDLNFTHALAKVRVVLAGENKKAVKNVKIKSLTSCTNTQGSISADGAAIDWIAMMECTRDGETCWEANVVPDQVITDFQVNETSGTLTQSISPLAANVNTITLTVGKAATIIQLGSNGNHTVNEGDNVIIDGNGQESKASINIKGTATITLRNVNLNDENNNSYVPVNIEKGTATIVLEGTNTLNGTIQGNRSAGIQLSGADSHVIIKGTEGSKLVVNAYMGNAAIGGSRSGTSGNITIENATIEAVVERGDSNGASAAIGTGSGYDGDASCGIIKIINSTITASVSGTSFGRAAVIGTGGTDSGNLSCAGIEITLKEGENKTTFLNRLTGDYYTQVGAGETLNGKSNTCGYVRWYNADGTEIK